MYLKFKLFSLCITIQQDQRKQKQQGDTETCCCSSWWLSCRLCLVKRHLQSFQLRVDYVNFMFASFPQHTGKGVSEKGGVGERERAR